MNERFESIWEAMVSVMGFATIDAGLGFQP
jgi:hypothetical protein